MERFTISKSEKQTIFEIYRACRLCGAGGGYRMPIIQNIIDLDSSEVELSKKIQECLQLEVRPDDRMPPLICELCVDKLNDFYKFLVLTRQTNVKTRTRLGLPIETAKKGEPETNDCILGVTEPVYIKKDDAAQKSKAGPKSSKKIKKEPEPVKVKIESTSDSSRSSSVSSRTDRPTRRAPSPRGRRSLPAAASAPAPAPASAPAPARRRPEKERSKPEKAPETPKTQAPKEKKGQVTKLQMLLEAPKEKKGQAAMKKEPQTLHEAPKEKKGPTGMRKELQTLLEDKMKFDDRSLLTPRALKRPREEPPRPALLPKRARAAPPREPAKELIKGPVKEPSPARTRPGPKSRKPVRYEPENILVPVKVPRTKKPETPAKAKEPPKPQTEPSPPAGPPYRCIVCEAQIKSAGAFTNHMRIHVPGFTKLTLACNPCGAWFATAEESASHHRYHREATFPYHCRRCFDDFRTLHLYDEHIDKGLCVQDEPPQAKCEECWAVYVSQQARAAHRCPGRSGRPGGKCSKCSRTYATAKTLKRHESQCGQRKTGDLIADPDVLRRLKPMRVRITRCDDLFRLTSGDHYDVSRVKPNYGLAKNYIYPYMKLPVRTRPLKRTNTVPRRDEPATDYSHWDSDDSDGVIIRKVPSLTTLTIKKLFSKDLLGKVPRKRKEVRYQAFENNDSNDASQDINDIINSLDEDLGNANVDRNAWTAKIKDIIGCLDDTDANDANYDKRDEVNQVADETTPDERQDDKVCNDKGSDESTNANLIESNERVDENCDESSNLEARVSEEPGNIEARVSEEPSNGEVNVSEEPSNAEANVSEELGNVVRRVRVELGNEETNVSEETRNVETRVSEEPSNAEANLSEEPSNAEANLSEEPSNAEANLSEEPSNAEANFSEESSMAEANVSEEPGNVATRVRVEPSKEETNVSEEPSNVLTRVSEEPRNPKTNVSEEPSNSEEILSNIVLETQTNNLDDENDKVNRIDTDINNPDSFKNKEIDVSLQNKENENEAAVELENVPVNGINHEETSMEVDKIDSNESKTEESKQTKESPIKHSIEHLIGDTDKNPDKYIKEVISSIENIIMNNSRNEQSVHENDKNLMDTLDEQIGEKRIGDNDKITLEDLLPNENRHEELENISDDDFNFDA